MEKLSVNLLVNHVRSCMLPHTSQIAEKTSFYSVPYLEYDFMIASIVRLSLAVLKISETSKEHASVGVLC